MNVSENAKLNSVSSKGQLDVSQYVRICEKENAALRVLFVGNSITRHGVKPDIGWHGDWGMAASSEDKDYVHRVVAGLEEKLGSVSYCVTQGATWERAYWEDDAILEAHYLPARDFAADLVIIRIGENIPRAMLEEHPVGEHWVHMVKFFAAKNPGAHVITTDNFWHIEALDTAFRAEAEKNGWHFVKLHDLESIEGTMAIGLFEHVGVARHPGDYGMQLIAERILAAVPDTLGGAK